MEFLKAVFWDDEDEILGKLSVYPDKAKSCARALYTISVSTNEKLLAMRRPNGLPMPYFLLQEQKLTFLHELIHLLNIAHGCESPGRRSSSDPHELSIDANALNILLNDPRLLREIVRTISTGENCFFTYESEDTPFFAYHKHLMADFLLSIRDKPRFGDVSHIKIYGYSQWMNIETSK